MFGRILGSVAALPLRIVNVPVQLTKRTIDAAGNFMDGGAFKSRRRDNAIDRLADGISETIEDTIDRDR